MTWNQQQEEADAEEKIDRCVKFADHVALVVSERKRALEAWQKAQQLQAELATLKAAHAWIKTSERAPNMHDTVLGLNRHGEVEVFVYCGTYWNPTDGHPDATAVKLSPFWMPLPEPPK